MTEGIAIGRSVPKLDGHVFGPKAREGHPSKRVTDADYVGIDRLTKDAIGSLR